MKDILPADMYPDSRKLLVKHEDYRTKVYQDTNGDWTGGIGRNISTRAFSADEIELMFSNDVNENYSLLKSNLPWFETLNKARQIALIDMSFMGWGRFLTFTEMLDALRRGDWKRAHDELLDSEYGEKERSRAFDLATILLTGVLP